MLEHFDAVSARDTLVKAIRKLAEEQGCAHLVLRLSDDEQSASFLLDVGGDRFPDIVDQSASQDHGGGQDVLSSGCLVVQTDIS